jgi:hypothetical protein
MHLIRQHGHRGVLQYDNKRSRCFDSIHARCVMSFLFYLQATLLRLTLPSVDLIFYPTRMDTQTEQEGPPYHLLHLHLHPSSPHPQQG